MNRKNADRSKQKKKRTAKDIVLDILLVVFLLIAVGSGAYLGRYYYIAKNAQNNFNDLKGMLDTDGDDTEKVTVEVSDKSKDNGEKKILKKFEKLYEKNSDIAGWLTIIRSCTLPMTTIIICIWTSIRTGVIRVHRS